MSDTPRLDSATPILDSGVLPIKRTKNIGRVFFGLILGIPFGAVLIVVANRAGRSHNPAANRILLLYFAAFAFAVILHELGHLTAGKFVGFRFNSITIGPFSLRLEYGQLRFQIRHSLPAGGYAGMQVQRVRRLRKRLIIFICGGPAANLGSAALSAAFLNYVLNDTDWITPFTEIFLIISLLLGVTSLMPLRLGALYPDGSRIWMLFYSRAKARRWMSIAAIGTQSASGIRLRDYRRTWLNAAGAVPDGTVDDFASNWTAYLVANDRKDAGLAAQRLERCLELVGLLGPLMQDVVAVEATVFTAWFRRDAVLAERWRASVRKFQAIPQLMRIRSDIALECAREDYVSALSRWQDGFSCINKLPLTPIRDNLVRGFLEWREEIEERQSEAKGKESADPLVRI